MRALFHHQLGLCVAALTLVLCSFSADSSEAQSTYSIRGRVRRAGAPAGLTLAYVRSQSQPLFGTLGPAPFELGLPSEFQYPPDIYSGIEVPGQEDGIADLGVSQYLHGGYLFLKGDGIGGFTPLPLPPQSEIVPHFEGGEYTPIDVLKNGKYQLLISDPGPGEYTIYTPSLLRYEHLEGKAVIFNGSQIYETPHFHGAGASKIADLNRDGRNDVVSVQSPSFTVTSPGSALPTIRFHYTLGIRHANIDGLSFQSFETGTLSPVFVPATHEMMQELTEVADGDNDGFPDLLLAHDNPGLNNAWSYRIVFNNQLGFFSGNEVFTYDSSYGGDVYVREWLGDDLNQIVELAHDSVNGWRMRLLEHSGSRTYTQRYAGPIPGLPAELSAAELRFVEDVDHDGRTDLGFVSSQSTPSGLTKTLHFLRNISQLGSVQFEMMAATFNVTGFAKYRLVDPFAIVGARVQIGSYSAFTDGDGRFTIRGVPAGIVPITAERTGYSITSAGGNSVSVGGGIAPLSLSASVATPTPSATPTPMTTSTPRPPDPISVNTDQIGVSLIAIWDKLQGSLSIRLPVRNTVTGADYAILASNLCTLELYGVPAASLPLSTLDSRHLLTSLSTLWGPQGWTIPIRATILKGRVAFIAAVRCANSSTVRFSSWSRFSTKNTPLKRPGAALSASSWLKKAKRVMKIAPASLGS